MAATDKPSFLIGVDETPEEKEVMDVLRDEPTTPEGGDNEQPTGDDSTSTDSGDTTGDTPSASDGDDSKPPTGDNAGDSDDSDSDGGADKPGNSGGDSPDKAGGDATPEKTPEDKESPEDAAKRQVDLKFGTFKSAEDAEKAFKEMQRTLTRLTQERKQTPGKQPTQEEQDALAKYVNLAKSTPLVDVKLPKAESYRYDDGSFDLDSYGRDIVRNTIMAIQQSLIGGQLGSMQFGLLQQAMNEEYRSGIEANQHQEKAAALEQKILTDYPIFKSNQKAADLLERAIYGEAARRAEIAKREGKEPEPMNEQDFLTLAQTLVENFNIPIAPQADEPADRIPQTPTMQPNGRPRVSQVDQDIDAMMKVKTKSGSIF